MGTVNDTFPVVAGYRLSRLVEVGGRRKVPEVFSFSWNLCHV